MLTSPKEGSNAKTEKEQFRTVQLPRFITFTEQELATLLDCFQVFEPWYLHSCMDTLLLNANCENLDPDERECLLAFMHSLNMMGRHPMDDED